MSAGGRPTGTLTIGCGYDAQHAAAEGWPGFAQRIP